MKGVSYLVFMSIEQLMCIIMIGKKWLRKLDDHTLWMFVRVIRATVMMVQVNHYFLEVSENDQSFEVTMTATTEVADDELSEGTVTQIQV